MKLKHYLITVDVHPYGSVHAYLLTKEKDRGVDYAIDKIFDIVGQLPLPIVLVTDLEGGEVLVTETIEKLNPGAAQRIAETKNFHLSIFAMPRGGENDRLLELH